MRRLPWLLLLLAGCAGPDSDPVEVASRFHALRLAGDDRGVHALLTESDRAAMPAERFLTALPSTLAPMLLGVDAVGLDSASLIRAGRDSAEVLLYAAGRAPDTLRLVSTRDSRGLWGVRRERVQWRVSMRLAEWARIDSLASSLREAADGATATERAGTYLRAVEQYPEMGRTADVDAARSTIRRAAVEAALRVDLRVTESFLGSRFVTGEIENPSAHRIATLRLTVEDGTGESERVELWDVGPRSTTAVNELTRLRRGPLTYRLVGLQVY